MKVNFEYNTSWHENSYIWRRNNSEKYNLNWIQSYGFKNYNNLSSEEIYNLNLDRSDSSHFQVVWLKNIDRLMDMLPDKIDPNEFNLIDSGCGSGISTLYFLDYYPFKNFYGFDFSEVLIKFANKNLDIFQRHSKNKSNLIKFETKNALDYKLFSEKNFVFMYNPFGFETAKVFIKNNLECLKKYNSIIAISNDIWIEELYKMNFHRTLIRDPKNNLSLVIY